MQRRFLLSKIHRATVTQADLDYEGSVSLPPELMDAADLHQNEAVQIWNVTRGTRIETYAILGQTGSSDICINGAAAHLMKPGDLVIIACFGYLNEHEAAEHEPKLVFVDENNQIKELRKEVPGPLPSPAVSHC
ncbi:MAG: aspartate 1-decarboxylase [Bdellovibrionales bacterium]|nr:aspartate 1-decarboxylase [Bdellovibrionales bacterium]